MSCSNPRPTNRECRYKPKEVAVGQNEPKTVAVGQNEPKTEKVAEGQNVPKTEKRKKVQEGTTQR